MFCNMSCAASVEEITSITYIVSSSPGVSAERGLSHRQNMFSIISTKSIKMGVMNKGSDVPSSVYRRTSTTVIQKQLMAISGSPSSTAREVTTRGAGTSA